MKEQNYFLIFAGVFSIVCAIGNWDWFMNNRKAMLWTKLFGRNGARIFYTVLGALLVAVGIFYQG